MEFHSTSTDSAVEPCAVQALTELDRLGDEIAELAVHLSAATARLLDLIREFDARGGWNHGFRSCAAWLTWRIDLGPGAAREQLRVARALGSLPLLAEAPRSWRTPISRGSRCWRTADAFQLERPSGWRATRAGW
jgi:hypothetical protein